MDANLLSAVKLALEMEKTGYGLYSKTAAETSQPVIAATFSELAKRELKHIEGIEILSTELAKDKIDYETVAKISSPVEKRQILENIMNNLKERLTEKIAASLSTVFDLALKLEKDSYNYYRKLEKEIQAPIVGKFFGLLAEEENCHYEIISESRLYLDRPRDWFWGKEDWVAEN